MADSIFKGKTLLITGGTGSFGHTVLKHFLSTDIGEIRIFSRDEKKQDDMRHELQAEHPQYAGKVKFYIGDVRNPQSIRDAMPGVNYIFHAAALKQVPSCEFFPMQAVQTNIIGTDNVLHAAIDAGVERVVCLSTDKAAYPINAMGISKAMMEHVIFANARVAAERGGTTICCTRYGNVMCSRGSVIPLFIDQIKAGNPITITDPNMTRFLMNLDEAVDLVMFAFEHANPGDLFIQKSDASTIGDLAKAVQAELEVQIPQLPRAAIARASVDTNGKIIVTDDMNKAIEAVNIIAPEHLEICVDDPFAVLNSVQNAGSIFLGKNVPEALGDYFAGPNHTLPTSGTARFSSPLGVDDFVKKSSFIYYTREALGEVQGRIANFAEHEGLHAHAKSVTIRFEE